MGLNGFVEIPFLYAEGSASELYSSRIDRGTKTVATGANRLYELVPDGTTFTGQLIVMLEDTVLDWKLGEPRKLGEMRTSGDKWLEGKKGRVDEKSQSEFINSYIIERLKRVNLLGGYKSKGFGTIMMEVK